MKIKFVISVGFNLVIGAVILCLNSCDRGIDKQLFVENGYYSLISSDSNSSQRAHIHFDYYTTSEQCVISGYQITLGEDIIGSIWETRTPIDPNVRYTISDTIRYNGTITELPKIKLGGFYVGSSANTPELEAECYLTPL